MRHLRFSLAEKSSFPVCLLVSHIRREEIQRAYLDPYALDPEDLLVLDLHYAQDKKKTPTAEIKTYIREELIPTLTDMGVEYILCSDSDYFKALTNVGKVDVNLGYILDCVFGPFKVIYVPSYRAMFYDPEKVSTKISQGIQALLDYRQGRYQPPGQNVIRFSAYPMTNDQIEDWLVRLLEMDKPLAIDIETFSLKHHTAGIGTIAFAWSEHEGIAFPVDYLPAENPGEAPFGKQERNIPVRRLLRAFFEQYEKKAVYHNIAFDVGVMIHQLYMDSIIDTQGLLKGMDVLLRNWDDTKLIAYLATNSCSGNELSLKDQAQEFAGNYAQSEIKDITRIPLNQLLEYNLVDACSTWHVHQKHWDTLVQDQQEEIYETIFKPATLDIIQMQLTGLPINMDRVKEVKAVLEADEKQALEAIQSSPMVQAYVHQLQENWVHKRNQELKKKRVTLDDAKDISFNPGSDPQLRGLLYEQLGLPILDWTDSRQASTGAKTLEKLLNHVDREDIKGLIQKFLDLSAVSILLTTFIPSFENAALGPDGWHYLFGNFNLGGTVSGRLSSSNPNLQNLPAGGSDGKKGKYGKLLKSCIQAPPGWIFAGLDFASLEDKISALTTKDPNKLKVYLDQFDGHCLRAFAYFGDQMEGIDGNSVESINSIQKKYKKLRQDSKAPTFALTYQGTYKTLINNCGFTESLARKIESSYHELYKVSDDWVAAKINQATRDGYITAAFGLRVRTPLLAQVIRGNRATPHEAEAEGRTAGNALGQSWCLLNSRAASEFMGKVRTSPHRLDIKPCAHIHDAQYYLLRDDLAVLAYTNQHLVEAVQWQDHPDIWHEEVKLGGELSIFHPNWSKEIVIPNGAGEDEILEIVNKALNPQMDKAA